MLFLAETKVLQVYELKINLQYQDSRSGSDGGIYGSMGMVVSEYFLGLRSDMIIAYSHNCTNNLSDDFLCQWVLQYLDLSVIHMIR